MSIFNVKDPKYAGGAKGDGLTDDTEAIQLALNDAEVDTDDSPPRYGGVVFFPPGVYRVNSIWIPGVPDDTPGPRTLQIPSNVTVRGSGVENTRIVQYQNWPMIPQMYRDDFWSIFVVPRTSPTRHTVAIEDMTIDGGYDLGLPNGGDFQRFHGIDIRNSNFIRVSRCRIVRCAGDGIRINNTNQPEQVWPPCAEILIENCSFDTIWRIGVSLGRDYRNVTIRDCVFRDWDDFIVKAEREFSTADDPAVDRGLTVTRCTCLPSASTGPRNLGSISVYSDDDDGQVLRDTTITNNILLEPMRFAHAHHVLIEGNTLTCTIADPAIDLWGGCHDVTIRHNTISFQDTTAGYPTVRAAGIRLGRNAVARSNTQILIASNSIQWTGGAPQPGHGHAIDIEAGTDIVVEGNVLSGAAVGGERWMEAVGLRVVPTASSVERLTVVHNILHGYETAVQLLESTGTTQLLDLVLSDNLLSACHTGVLLMRPAGLARLALSGNALVELDSDGMALRMFSATALPWLIAGVHGSGAGAVGFFVGAGAPGASPEARVQNAAVGSLYLDRDATQPSPTLFVRESTGWAPH